MAFIANRTSCSCFKTTCCQHFERVEFARSSTKKTTASEKTKIFKLWSQFLLAYRRECSGCPILVRTDCGTENGTVAAIQSYFRQEGNDEFAGEKSHTYGTSPANQRIECWWSSLRRARTSWWIDHFSNIVNTGLVDTKLSKECLWFCYERVLQDELDKVKHHQNTHRICPSRHSTVPGIPNVLYHLPHRSDGMDCKVTIPAEKEELCQFVMKRHQGYLCAPVPEPVPDFPWQLTLSLIEKMKDTFFTEKRG
ncbi:uncharacterized protein LOC111327021 isoform X2 [Stylophora pistillata]|uniref:uncharacterized protein LOC111327021 isoform X2 n=1 Tax=Stylophora pistillata TaxID=50429 RepID=UPI000C04D761|nr:uncharacterized protein LOC111327021 isoform X2 [Stylophora pistillata]